MQWRTYEEAYLVSSLEDSLVMCILSVVGIEECKCRKQIVCHESLRIKVTYFVYLVYIFTALVFSKD